MTNKDDIKDVLTTTILSTFKEENFKLMLKDVLKNEILTKLVSDKNILFQNQSYKNFEEFLYCKIKNFRNSSEFKNSLYIILNKRFMEIEKSDYTFSKIIPTTFINSLKVYVYNNKDNIATSIKATLNSEKMQTKIKDELTKALGTLPPLASKFFNGDKIYSKISLGINSYFESEENLMNMVNMINGTLDKLMQKNISDFLTYLPVEGKNSLIDTFCNIIINNLFSDETINKIIISIKEKFNNKTFIKDLITTNQKDFDNLLNDLSDKYYARMLESNKLKEVIDNISDTLVEKLLEMPLKEFI